jgi:ribulose-5-phosphate 4-epimerase/fuculose-1-phosphate aldolase
MSIDEGVIKFNATGFQETAPLDLKLIPELNDTRQRLYTLSLIGEYPEINIGYGNISMRLSPKLVAAFSDASLTANAFIISGTQTGRLETLSGQHYTCVTGFNLKDNSLQVTGPIMASSESLTHGAIYQCHSGISAVIHIHSPLIWQGMLKDGYDQTSASIPYGTLEMANAVQQLVGDGQQGSIAMAGHEDGVVFYGPSMQAALSLCMEVYDKYVA